MGMAAMSNARLERKKKKLIDMLGKLDSLGVAFSGGVDSTYLLAMARQVLGEGVIALTAESPLHPSTEIEMAAEYAGALGIEHIRVPSKEMALAEFRTNPVNRCYICKKSLFSQLMDILTEKGIYHLAHGANTDDLSDFRPGFKAAEEIGALAPLLEAGMNKADIRRLSRQMGLPTWDKPAMACLATRIPYHTRIEKKDLTMVEGAERYLMNLGFKTCRVRHHGDVARIEIDPAEFEKIIEPPTRVGIIEALRKIGYRYVSVDLSGYVQGHMNPSAFE
jgi:uncharacterized protein